MTVREVSNEFDIDRVKDIPWKKEVSDRNTWTARSQPHVFFVVVRTSSLRLSRIALPTLFVSIHIPTGLSVLQPHH